MSETTTGRDNRTGSHITDANERLEVLAAIIGGMGVTNSEAWSQIVFATVRGRARMDVCRAALRGEDPAVPFQLARYLDTRRDERGVTWMALTAAGLWWLAEEVWRRPCAVA